ncbi:hypothetical protein [Phocaeicola salanitronis]|uniref:hypothetical protein n=1 Tax=Phocaeicola salanitronis TaxID=376805 RepID=UPI0005A0A79F|nr:hypothetical protein [Phocaeicola salanitronis]
MSPALSQLKNELLNPITDAHEVLLVFYIAPNAFLWKALLENPCSSVYFIKKSDQNRALLDNLFEAFACTDNSDQMSPHILRLIVNPRSNDFFQEFIDSTYTIPPGLNGGTIQEFIDVFINQLDAYIVKI